MRSTCLETGSKTYGARRARAARGAALLTLVVVVSGCRFADLFEDIPAPEARTTEVLRAPEGTLCATPTGKGHVVYHARDKVFRIEARVGAEPEDISAALDRFSSGTDKFINTSPNGRWLLVQTTRFGCLDECLAIVSGDLCSAQVVKVDGRAPEVNGHGVLVSNDGNTVIFPAYGGPHTVDLWETHRAGANNFTAPKLLTKDSPAPFNQQPAISNNGTRLAYECSRRATAAEGGASVCESNIDGTGLRVVVGPESGPWGTQGAIHHPVFSPDNRVVFESSWDGNAEQIWSVPLPAANAAPTTKSTTVTGTPPVSEVSRLCAGRAYTNDNTPCSLPDGRVVSLWLGRSGSAGHELKITSTDCSETGMLLSGIDINDVGLGCSR
jgi:hypothetical protein